MATVRSRLQAGGPAVWCPSVGLTHDLGLVGSGHTKWTHGQLCGELTGCPVLYQHLGLLPTSWAGNVMRSVVSVRPSVFTLSSEPTDL